MGLSASTIYVSDWITGCAARFNCSSSGLVNFHGQATSCPANGTIQSAPYIWGITFAACQAECGTDRLVQSIDFSSAAVPLATWLLPWIGLIAQLPFEADGWMDLLSACLCVGSPALATYSLALTTFNRQHINAQFKRLKEKAEKYMHQRYQYMADRIDAAAFVLKESQQCPMRADQRMGDFASLIVLPDRQNFWMIAAKDLNNTRRGFTYSFLAQVVLAFTSYLISFIAAVHDSLGSPHVGLQFASSSVWSWMFPIVFGYIRVGSQFQAGAIKAALVDHTVVAQRGFSRHGGDTTVMHQRGLRPDADLYLPLSPEGGQSSTQLSTQLFDGGVTSLESHQNKLLAEDLLLSPADAGEFEDALSPPTWLGMDVRGDEWREGPIFNYARIFTWFAFADHVERAFKVSLHQFRVSLRSHATIPEPVTTDKTQISRTGTAQEGITWPLATAQAAASCCGLAVSQDLRAFASWEGIPSAAIKHIFYAALLALFLQWGTTGAAIFVAYFTPTVGLGCRSGSYLIYGVAATLSWLLLVVSQFASHAVMHRLERDPYRRNVGIRILGGVAVITRLLGKVIAITNAGWLIASSVLEEIGVFATCWCQTVAFQYHTAGWAPVFKGAADLRNEAARIWIGGFTWSIVVCLVTAVIFSV
ncbi:hypothetical protein MSAN_02033000 [Mycena sanguinolenta]|uniref:Uncharacterized protein n=1 Tax=Mycena sanguinolenta TaxID=230812 RepID=A0A8H7CL60_9AGAR|nr:hypothetical protein MSAN_02033000 [Mycena sanguinolenta]